MIATIRFTIRPHDVYIEKKIRFPDNNIMRVGTQIEAFLCGCRTNFQITNASVMGIPTWGEADFEFDDRKALTALSIHINDIATHTTVKQIFEPDIPR